MIQILTVVLLFYRASRYPNTAVPPQLLARVAAVVEGLATFNSMLGLSTAKHSQAVDGAMFRPPALSPRAIQCQSTAHKTELIDPNLDQLAFYYKRRSLLHILFWKIWSSCGYFGFH